MEILSEVSEKTPLKGRSIGNSSGKVGNHGYSPQKPFASLPSMAYNQAYEPLAEHTRKGTSPLAVQFSVIIGNGRDSSLMGRPAFAIPCVLRVSSVLPPFFRHHIPKSA